MTIFNTSKTKEISGQRYVKAIIAYMKEKKCKSVTFEKNTYADWNDIPFCQALQDVVDTVSISENKPGCIVISICREDGFMAYAEFDGSEQEDFEYLFFNVYYHINDPEDIVAEEWFEEFERKFYNPLSCWLVDQIKKHEHLYRKGIKIPATFLDENGFEYDTISVMEINGEKVVGLVDSSNGNSNPTITSLDSLTASDLLLNYIFLLNKERESIIDDYDWAVAKFDSMEGWATDAVNNLIKENAISGISKRKASASYIYETLRYFQAKGITGWETKRDLEFIAPYLIHLDHLQGFSQEGLSPFFGFKFVPSKGEITKVDNDGIKYEPSKDNTIEIEPIGISGFDNKPTILCRPEGITTGWDGEYTVLPDESVANLEKMCQHIMHRNRSKKS